MALFYLNNCMSWLIFQSKLHFNNKPQYQKPTYFSSTFWLCFCPPNASKTHYYQWYQMLDYTIMLIRTIWYLIKGQNQREYVWTWVKDDAIKNTLFRYKETTANHYLCRGSINSCNRWRHKGGANQGFILEETWDTKRREYQVFAIVFAITEMTVFLAMDKCREAAPIKLAWTSKVTYMPMSELQFHLHQKSL